MLAITPLFPSAAWWMNFQSCGIGRAVGRIISMWQDEDDSKPKMPSVPWARYASRMIWSVVFDALEQTIFRWCSKHVDSWLHLNVSLWLCIRIFLCHLKRNLDRCFGGLAWYNKRVDVVYRRNGASCIIRLSLTKWNQALTYFELVTRTWQRKERDFRLSTGVLRLPCL
jgi:hypothetical protein